MSPALAGRFFTTEPLGKPFLPALTVKKKKDKLVKFPGDGMVKTLHFHSLDQGSIPGLGTMIPQHQGKKTKQTTRSKTIPNKNSNKNTLVFCENLDSSRNLYQI